jgi:hypothetical protein
MVNLSVSLATVATYDPTMTTPFAVVDIGKFIVSLLTSPCAVRLTVTDADPDTVVNVGTAPPLLTVDVAFLVAVMV